MKMFRGIKLRRWRFLLSLVSSAEAEESRGFEVVCACPSAAAESLEESVLFSPLDGELELPGWHIELI